MAGTASDRETAVRAWCALDRARALVAADHEIAEGASALRAVILDFARAGGSDDEIYDACALLGRLIAQRGGSPTLASSTADNAAQALGEHEAPWLSDARAAVAEGFTLALADLARLDTLRTWDFPRCAVPLPGGAVAIAAGNPSDDPEVLAEWAARIAKEAAMRGVRRAYVAGSDAARAAVRDALDVVGIGIA